MKKELILSIIVSLLIVAIIAFGIPTYSGITANPSSPTIYSSGATYVFNITWDTPGPSEEITDVYFETNFLGSSTNYTASSTPAVINVTGNENGTGTYGIEFYDLAAGSYSYRWFAVNNASEENGTSSQTYTINTAPSPVELYLNTLSQDVTIDYGTQSNATAIPTIGTVYLYRDGVLKASGALPVSEITTLPVGTYVYKANGTSDNANYSNNVTGLTYTLTVGGLSDGSSCTAASQCTGGYCVHNICRSSATYCGDNYCDGGEVGSCVADCGAVEAKTWVETERGKASITIPTIAASSMATVEIEKTEDLAMRQISISVANKVNSVAIKIEKLDAKPAELEKPTDKVYHYIEVTKANIMDNDINNVKFQFAVDKSWLNENNIDPSRVGLNRWTPTPSISGSFIGFLNNLFSITGFAIVEPGEWNKLTTTKVSETTDEIIYEAESPGLSFFSIVGETVAVVPTAPPTVPTIPPTDYTWIWIIIIIIIIGGGYWYFKLKKPSK